MIKVAPSLLAADYLRVGDDIRRVAEAGADYLHFDVMDGSFVPNISFGPEMCRRAASCGLPVDAHLMVVHPERWVKRCAGLGVSMMSFHQEAAGEQTGAILDDIKANGMKAGLVVNPDIAVSRLFPYIGQADYFLIMSVFAGFGGQKFIPESLHRIQALKEEISRKGLDTPIEVDGGVNTENASLLRDAGATILVAGSSVFKAEDPSKAVALLRNPK